MLRICNSFRDCVVIEQLVIESVEVVLCFTIKIAKGGDCKVYIYSVGLIMMPKARFLLYCRLCQLKRMPFLSWTSFRSNGIKVSEGKIFWFENSSCGEKTKSNWRIFESIVFESLIYDEFLNCLRKYIFEYVVQKYLYAWIIIRGCSGAWGAHKQNKMPGITSVPEY